MKRVALAIGTAFGAGYAPVAPGTAGSAVGVVVYFVTRGWPLGWQLGLLAALTVMGVWAGGVCAHHFETEDPGQVVIDEVVGQLVTLYATHVGIMGAALGFFIFRVLDVIKPWPARQFERLPGGVGITADDVMAGVYGNLLLRVVRLVLPGAW